MDLAMAPEPPLVPDLQDLKTHMKSEGVCPYYAARKRMNQAELILMPYNYLLNPSIRKSLGLNFSHSVVIIDEAHNILSAAEDTFSIELSLANLKVSLKSIERISLNKQVLISKHLNWAKTTLSAFCDYLQDYPSNPRQPDTRMGGFSLPGYQIQTLIERITSTSKTHFILDEGEAVNRANHQIYLDVLFQCLNQCYKSHYSVEGLQSWINFIKLVFESFQSEEGLNSCYIYIHQGQSKLFNFWCFSASACFNQIKEIQLHSLILTSGTLSPLDTWTELLDIQFPHRIECPHIIERNQVGVQVLPGTFSWQKRHDQEELRKLGQGLLLSIANTVGGVLVFFSSYSMMNLVISEWQLDGTIQKMEKHKSLFYEDKNPDKSVQAMKDYQLEIRKTKQGVLFAVMRGKASEGLNFVNDLARLVVVVGIPYANPHQPKIELKMRYLDNRARQEKRLLKGWDWYEEDALRAVNQAAGRIIRHREDYGAVVLIGQKYKKQSIRLKLSQWMQKRLEFPESGQKYVQNLKEFFEANKDLQELARQRSQMRKKELQQKYPHLRKEKSMYSSIQKPKKYDYAAKRVKANFIPPKRVVRPSDEPEEAKSASLTNNQKILANLQKWGISSLKSLMIDEGASKEEEKINVRDIVSKPKDDENMKKKEVREDISEGVREDVREDIKEGKGRREESIVVEKKEQKLERKPSLKKYEKYLDLF